MEGLIEVKSWDDLKSIYNGAELSSMHYCQFNNGYLIFVVNGPMKFSLWIDNNDTDIKNDFDNNYKSQCNKDIKQESVTQSEKNDKTLRMVYAFAECNEEGVARVAVKIPSNGRKIAYGDAEFEVRKFGDVVSKIEAADLERRLAWFIALSQNPEATEPVSDEVVQAMTREQLGGEMGPFPLYPTLDYYDERNLKLGEDAPFNEGTVIGGGCTMTFEFGVTEVQPVGGYGNLDGEIYLIIEVKNVLTPRTQGERAQFSLDWGEPNES